MSAISTPPASAWVRGRAGPINKILALDTGKLFTDPLHAKLGGLNVCQSPVGIAVDKSGRRRYVASSNRFAVNPGVPQIPGRYEVQIDAKKKR